MLLQCYTMRELLCKVRLIHDVEFLDRFDFGSDSLLLRLLHLPHRVVSSDSDRDAHGGADLVRSESLLEVIDSFSGR